MAKYDVGILGAGRMGAAFVRHFAAQGLDVAVWNRSPDKAEALVSPKVTALSAADELLDQADLVINLVSGYENLERILRGRQSRSPIDLLNLSTGTPGEALAMLSALPEGSRYLDGANLNFPQDIGSERGFIGFAGSAQLWHEHRELFASLSGDTAYLSDDASSANVLDAGYVGIFEIPSIVAFLESADYLAGNGISDDVVQKLIDVQARNLGGVLREVFAERSTGVSPGSAALGTYGLAAQLYRETVGKAGHFPKQLAAARTALDGAIAAGLGESSIAALVGRTDSVRNC